MQDTILQQLQQNQQQVQALTGSIQVSKASCAQYEAAMQTAHNELAAARHLKMEAEEELALQVTTTMLVPTTDEFDHHWQHDLEAACLLALLSQSTYTAGQQHMQAHS
jgi:hypothetical protein